MKKLLSVLMLTLAMNFLLAGGGVAWLVKTHHLDKDRFKQVKEILFPKVDTDLAGSPTTQPDPTTQPSRLDNLLAKASGRTAAEQVDFIQQTFDAQAAQLDRRERELNDLQRQVDLAKQQMSADRAKVEADRADLTTRRQQDVQQASDKGFQDSLLLYSSMPAKNVKQIFLTLSDDTVQRYIEAMDPRAATKIIKEYKSPDELTRIQKVLERMRTATADSKPNQPIAQTPTSP